MKREKTSSRKGAKPGKKTERKKRPAKTEEKALLESERRFRTLAEHAPDIIVRFDKQLRHLYVNPAVEKVTGIPREKYIGKTNEELGMPEELCALWNRTLKKVFRTGDTGSIEFGFQAANGTRVFEFRAVPELSDGGSIESVLVITRDISEHKRMEQALRESQKDLKRAQAVAHTGSWRLDVRRNVLLWSDETHRIFGVPRGTPMTYETFLATVHPEDREYVDQQWQAALRGEPYEIEHRIVVDGAVKWVRERAELEFDKEEVLLGGFGTAQDITELRKAEEALRQSRDTLEIMVKERTTELLQANNQLKEENEERLRTEQSLRLEGARLDALLRLSHFSEASGAEIAAFVLEQGIELTQSKIGFVGLLSEDESVYTLHAVSKNVVKECNVTGDPVQWHIAGAGVWADAIRERKTLFINDYSKPHPRKKGVPPGHPPVERFMVVPSFEGERIVAVAGVGNKTSDYDHSDERQIALLLGGMWTHVQRNRSREELQKAHDELEQKVEQRTAELIVSNTALQNEITEHRRSEKALRELKNQLEVRVQERTAEIKGVLETLQEEMAERKQAEEELRRTKAVLEKTMASLVDVVFVVNPASRTIIACNKAVETMFGHTEREVIGRNTEFLFKNREMYEEFGSRLFPALDARGVYHTNNEMRRKDGTVFPTEITVTEMLDDSGERTGTVSLVRDISKRVLAKRMLRESEARFRSLFEDSRDPVYVVALDGTFVDFNQAMIDLFGYSREELMDKNIRDLYANPDERFRFQRFIERRGAVRGYGIRFRRKNGRARECLVTASLRRAEDGTILGYQGIIRDITRQRRYQRVLQNYADRLRTLSQKLLDAQENERRIIARDLHDSIGGSLSAIKFTLSRKLGQMNEGEASREILLENIISMVQRTIDENRRIMTELRPSLLDDLGVVETIDWFCGEFEGVYPNIRLEQHVEIEESEIPEHLKIVTFRICQEALNNIAKHSGGNFACISFTKRDSSLELTITDNGQGFDAKRLVDKELRGHIGIPGMRERVQLSGGTFSIESKLEGGTTVRAKWEIKNNEK